MVHFYFWKYKPIISLYFTDCPALTAPTNGALSTDVVMSGTSVDVTCTGGYTLSGTSPIVCNEGIWSDSVPTCPQGNIL